MPYLINSDPEQVSDEAILKLVNRRVMASREDILNNIHGYEFIGIQQDKLRSIQAYLDDINKCIALIDGNISVFSIA